MKDNRNYAAIAIGEFKIRIIIAKIINSNIYIIGNEEVATDGIENFKIINHEKFNNALTTLLKKTKEKYPNINFSITLILPAYNLNVYKKSATINVFDESKIISEKDIFAVRRNCAKSNLNNDLEVIEVIPLYYGSFDANYLYPPVGIYSPTISLTSYNVTMPKDVAHSYVSAIENVGFTIENIISGPSASSYYFKSTVTETNYVIVDIAYNSTKISLIIDGKVAAIKVIYIGSNNFTLAIAEKLGLTIETAEDLKIKFANPQALAEDIIYKSGDKEITEIDLNSIINGRLEFLINEIKLIISSLIADKSLPVFLIGGGSEIKNIKEKFQSYIDLPISTVRPSIIGIRKFQYIPLIGACLATYEKNQPVKNVQIEVKEKHRDNFETASHFLDILKGKN